MSKDIDVAKLLPNPLNDYVNENHTQEECSGFIDGFEKAIDLVKNGYLHNVSQRTYFFDCWKMNGVMDCKEVVATCEEHAILKFEKEFDDYGYDPPYVG